MVVTNRLLAGHWWESTPIRLCAGNLSWDVFSIHPLQPFLLQLQGYIFTPSFLRLAVVKPRRRIIRVNVDRDIFCIWEVCLEM